ncbi:ABC transporter permease [Govanella unica]|uniref:MlaE family lipid ABC transporter permease subunit n=1 Tax=Govanella unica TaxID=2975056 RepID=A0A9X3TXD7_9PROT|nr:MlaE family lipid ABC transporter permease subunit [Govania unica]
MSGTEPTPKSDPAFESAANGQTTVFHFSGSWTVLKIGSLYAPLTEVAANSNGPVSLDLANIASLDTAGAWLIYRLTRDLKARNIDVTVTAAQAGHQSLIDEVGKNDHPCRVEPEQRRVAKGLLEDVGRGTVESLKAGRSLVWFVGMVTVSLFGLIKSPSRMRWTSLVFHMEEIGVRAMPIVGLMSFLIGVVIAQQGEFQLSQFGASVLVINLLGISIVREIAILITAIMVAGRSGSAFTAEIGTMELNEEVDAMRTFGISPIETLAIPRILAIILMMPLLTFYSDIIALVGGGIFCWLSLNIEPQVFVQRLHASLDFNNFMVGMIKAPFFAAVIGVTGCYEGLMTRGGAEAVGRQTTRSVVEAIFLVIVLDAAFAVFFSAIGM